MAHYLEQQLRMTLLAAAIEELWVALVSDSQTAATVYVAYIEKQPCKLNSSYKEHSEQ